MAHTVLVIEDSKDVLDNMKEILELSNYTVHVAHNGTEGLEIAQQNIPDIILCDVMMPELDGYSVLRGLTNNPKTKNIPFKIWVKQQIDVFLIFIEFKEGNPNKAPLNIRFL